MKFLCIIFSLFFTTQPEPEPSPPKQESIQIIKNSPFLSFSAEFIINKQDEYFGKVIRTGFMRPQYHYALYDKENNLNAKGITRIMSMGLIFPSAMDIDIYDNEKTFIGFIEGKLFKRSRAKFNFYDNEKHLNAVAYINDEAREVVIVAANNPSKILIKLTGEDFGEIGSLNFIDSNTQVDEKIIKIFAAFISDYYASFLIDYKKRIKGQFMYFDSR